MTAQEMVRAALAGVRQTRPADWCDHPECEARAVVWNDAGESSCGLHHAWLARKR